MSHLYLGCVYAVTINDSLSTHETPQGKVPNAPQKRNFHPQK